MTTFKVVQVRRDKNLEWTVERSPRGGAYDLQCFYLSKAEAEAEADRLRAMADHPHAAHPRDPHMVDRTRS